MAALIVNTVIDALNEAGIPAQSAYPGGVMPELTEARAAVGLEKLDHTVRSAQVLVTVTVPVGMGGSACEDAAIRAGEILEELGGICIQEACRFDGYADAYYVRVLGTFYGAAVMESWETAADFTVKLGGNELANAVSFQAEQVVDPETGEPLSSAVWTFRLEEEFARGESQLPPPTEPFSVTVSRSSGTETYNDCTWISVELENTATGLRQVRKGVAKTRSFIVII